MSRIKLSAKAAILPAAVVCLLPQTSVAQHWTEYVGAALQGLEQSPILAGRRAPGGRWNGAGSNDGQNGGRGQASSSWQSSSWNGSTCGRGPARQRWNRGGARNASPPSEGNGSSQGNLASNPQGNPSNNWQGDPNENWQGDPGGSETPVPNQTPDPASPWQDNLQPAAVPQNALPASLPDAEVSGPPVKLACPDWTGIPVSMLLSRDAKGKIDPETITLQPGEKRIVTPIRPYVKFHRGRKADGTDLGYRVYKIGPGKHYRFKLDQDGWDMNALTQQ